MTLNVGIPRGLFYHYYFPLWQTFFSELGAEVIVSPPTNKTIVDLGLKYAVDEACLPVKIYYGHVLELRDRADWIFVPRLVSVAQKEFICPKLMGLPDMLKQSCPDLPPLLDIDVDFSKNPDPWPLVRRVGHLFTPSPSRIRKAWEIAKSRYLEYHTLLLKGYLPVDAHAMLEGRRTDLETEGKVVVLLGHNYNLYDNYSSMNLVEKLRRLQARVISADSLSDAVLEREVARLPKRIFWTLGKRVVGATFNFLECPEVVGIIHVTSFGCGPDSLTGDMVERIVRRDGRKAFLGLTFDEHTGEAGINTRLEAFMDMIEWGEAR